jgi:CheY-like chemotaxis protein
MAKILVVDNHRDSRDVFAELLTARGHQVTIARDGIEAAALLAHRTPDLVLIDLPVPGREGFELIQLIRSRWPKVRTIAISPGWRTVADSKRAFGLLEEAAALGADVTLRKPVEANALFEAIDRLVADDTSL